MERIWLKRYPTGVPAEIDPDRHASIVSAFRDACAKFGPRPCFTSMGATITFTGLEEQSAAFAAYLLKDLGLAKGDRIAIQAPNVLAYPVVLFGALRAGLIVVNTNPLYTPREMEHQFRDAGVKAIVILANFAANLQQIIGKLGDPHVVVMQIADLFPPVKRVLVNAIVRYVKKMVPAYDLPKAVPFLAALDAGRRHGRIEDAALRGDDLAFLQYTGGTTGVSKGAMLTHRNVVANMEQACEWMKPKLVEGEEVIITALPLYHIFSLTVNCLTFMRYGARNVLITNPRDIPGFVKTLRTSGFTIMTGVNTLFNALMNHPEFGSLDMSRVKLSVAGAMALQTAVAERWRTITKSIILEGYGLTEASPIVACNPVDGTDRIGTIGLPFPSTEIKIVDDDGVELPIGKAGELAVRGPQVMRGYWQRDDETANVLRDGWLFTGDVAQIDEDGFLKIVDRKKDMILVSGFNVYPNEVEEVVASHPGVLEVAALGVPDDKSGEAVKIFVVKRDPSLDADSVLRHCRERLTGYKMPKHVEFRTELPKTNVGKVLRRALRT